MISFELNVHFYHHIEAGDWFADLKSMLETFMAEIDDEFTKLEALIKEGRTSQDEALARVSEDVADFKTTIAAMTAELATLKQQVADGRNDPVFLQRVKDAEVALEEMIAKNKVLDPTQPDVIPPEELPA